MNKIRSVFVGTWNGVVVSMVLTITFVLCRKVALSLGIKGVWLRKFFLDTVEGFGSMFVFFQKNLMVPAVMTYFLWLLYQLFLYLRRR